MIWKLDMCIWLVYRILKSGDEMLTISGFFCHGENLFIQMETTAPPPRRKKRKKIGIRYFKSNWQYSKIHVCKFILSLKTNQDVSCHNDSRNSLYSKNFYGALIKFVSLFTGKAKYFWINIVDQNYYIRLVTVCTRL